MKVKNFRCLTDADIRFDQLTIFMGRNGSGKSSVLNALRIFFEPDASVSTEDFFNGDLSVPIEIEVQLNDFTLEEKKDLSCYIQDGKMTVLKRITWNTESKHPVIEYFSFLKQIPEFAKIRQLKTAKEKSDEYKILREKFQELEKYKNLTQMEEQMRTYEQNHPAILRAFFIHSKSSLLLGFLSKRSIIMSSLFLPLHFKPYLFSKCLNSSFIPKNLLNVPRAFTVAERLPSEKVPSKLRSLFTKQ